MKRAYFAGLAGLLSVVLFATSCSEDITRVRAISVAPSFDAVPGPPVLDQRNGTIGFNGSDIRKGFNPTNPQTGDAIIATFIWQGSTNVITSVHDELTNGTPVGNTYNLVEYRTAGGVSMATYVALNVQNIPDNQGNQDLVEVVIGTLSSPITNGGIMISAYRGVATANALTGHASAGGTASTTAVVSGGSITPGDGSLLYTASFVAPNAPVDPPPGMNEVNYLSTPETKILGEWTVQSGGGASDPQWTWYFSQPSSWITTNLGLRPNVVAPPNTAPVVNAGEDETVLASPLFTENWSFTDPDNGPWSYTIDWGDGMSSTGTKSAPGSFGDGHTYGALLLGQHTIRITVTDSQGASHTDTKVVTVVLF